MPPPFAFTMKHASISLAVLFFFFLGCNNKHGNGLFLVRAFSVPKAVSVSQVHRGLIHNNNKKLDPSSKAQSTQSQFSSTLPLEHSRTALFLASTLATNNATDLRLVDDASTTSALESSAADAADATTTEISPSSSSSSLSNSNKYPETPSFRKCLAFALPALGIYVCSPLMSLIDASFIGKLSTSTELAALGPASSISDSAPLPLLFLSIASTNLIAKSFAADDHAASVRVSRTALGLGAVCSLVLATLLYTQAQAISILYCGGPRAAAAQLLAPACTQYVAIRALALPAVVVTTIAQAICIGTKDTKTPMISVAAAGLLNLVGDLILVKWMGQGIAGAAGATSLSQVVAAGLLLRVLHKRGFLVNQKEQKNGTEDTLSVVMDDGKTLSSSASQQQPVKRQDQNAENTSTMATVKQLLAFIPFLFIMSVKIGWHNSCTATAASLGGVSSAAHTALLSVAMVCMVLGDVGSSLSQAFLPAFETTTTTATTPNNSKDSNGNTVQSAKGASGKRTTTFDMEAAMPTVKQLLKCTLSISGTVVTLAAVIIGIFGGQITSDPAVLAKMRSTLPWILTSLSFHGSAVTLEGLLLSRKKFNSLTVCYSVLAVTVAAFQIATRRFGLGLAGVWGCYVWFCASRVIAFSALGGLLRPRRWLEKIRNNSRLGRIKAEAAQGM